jgi:hypothetical protein
MKVLCPELPQVTVHRGVKYNRKIQGEQTSGESSPDLVSIEQRGAGMIGGKFLLSIQINV